MRNLKQTVILWGGYHKAAQSPLNLLQINSHASVAFYFLHKELSAYFEVITIDSFDAARSILDYPGALAVISTFQGGFTRLAEKQPENYELIRLRFNGYLCSLIDKVSAKSYKEDILFSLEPTCQKVNLGLREKIFGNSVFPIGWCGGFQSNLSINKSKRPRVFVDHPNYAGKDINKTVQDACSRLLNTRAFDVYSQTNDGISRGIEAINPTDGYRRSSKVPWVEMQKFYSGCDVFVMTHRESGGLSVLEAGIAGCFCVIPRSKIRGSFIRKNILKASGLHYQIVRSTPEDIANGIKKGLDRSEDRNQRACLARQMHSWANGAARIAYYLLMR